MSDPTQPDKSGRGFAHYNAVPGEYGGGVRVYESSAMSAPHIWLAATCPSNMNDPTSPPVEAVVHLTLENAQIVRDQLTHLIENHYQVPRPTSDRAVITVTLDLEPAQSFDEGEVEEALANLASIMAVQAEDGLYSTGDPDSEADDNRYLADVNFMQTDVRYVEGHGD